MKAEGEMSTLPLPVPKTVEKMELLRSGGIIWMNWPLFESM
jgi:hypothetical protein